MLQANHPPKRLRDQPLTSGRAGRRAQQPAWSSTGLKAANMTTEKSAYRAISSQYLRLFAFFLVIFFCCHARLSSFLRALFSVENCLNCKNHAFF
jgi:hypothetical protein